MKLLTKANRRELPALYATDKTGFEPKAVVKFFDPCGSWSWYAAEFDGDDTFYGLVDGHSVEYGYFTLSELEGFRGPLGIGIERDRHFTPKSLHWLKDCAVERRVGGG